MNYHPISFAHELEGEAQYPPLGGWSLTINCQVTCVGLDLHSNIQL